MRKKNNYSYEFDRIVFNNRWVTPDYSRQGSWVIVGIGIRYSSPTSFQYYFSFFGFDIRVWFNREIKSYSFK